MGGSPYLGYSQHHSALEKNHDSLSKKYALDSQGRLGVKDKGSQVFLTPDPVATAIEFFHTLGQGALEEKIGGDVQTKSFSAKTLLVLRLVSSDGSPALTIQFGPRNPKSYKIHFKPLDYKPKGK